MQAVPGENLFQGADDDKVLSGALPHTRGVQRNKTPGLAGSSLQLATSHGSPPCGFGCREEFLLLSSGQTYLIFQLFHGGNNPSGDYVLQGSVAVTQPLWLSVEPTSQEDF